MPLECSRTKGLSRGISFALVCLLSAAPMYANGYGQVSQDENQSHVVVTMPEAPGCADGLKSAFKSPACTFDVRKWSLTDWLIAVPSAAVVLGAPLIAGWQTNWFGLGNNGKTDNNKESTTESIVIGSTLQLAGVNCLLLENGFEIPSDEQPCGAGVNAVALAACSELLPGEQREVCGITVERLKTTNTDDEENQKEQKRFTRSPEDGESPQNLQPASEYVRQGQSVPQAVLQTLDQQDWNNLYQQAKSQGKDGVRVTLGDKDVLSTCPNTWQSYLKYAKNPDLLNTKHNRDNDWCPQGTSFQAAASQGCFFGDITLHALTAPDVVRQGIRAALAQDFAGMRLEAPVFASQGGVGDIACYFVWEDALKAALQASNTPANKLLVGAMEGQSINWSWLSSSYAGGFITDAYIQQAINFAKEQTDSYGNASPGLFVQNGRQFQVLNCINDWYTLYNSNVGHPQPPVPPRGKGPQEGSGLPNPPSSVGGGAQGPSNFKININFVRNPETGEMISPEQQDAYRDAANILMRVIKGYENSGPHTLNVDVYAQNTSGPNGGIGNAMADANLKECERGAASKGTIRVNEDTFGKPHQDSQAPRNTALHELFHLLVPLDKCPQGWETDWSGNPRLDQNGDFICANQACDTSSYFVNKKPHELTAGEGMSMSNEGFVNAGNVVDHYERLAQGRGMSPGLFRDGVPIKNGHPKSDEINCLEPAAEIFGYPRGPFVSPGLWEMAKARGWKVDDQEASKLFAPSTRESYERYCREQDWVKYNAQQEAQWSGNLQQAMRNAVEQCVQVQMPKEACQRAGIPLPRI